MHFDGTITLGTVISAATFALAIFVAYHKATRWLDVHLTQFEMTLQSHAQQLMDHAARMNRYEARYVTIAEELQYIAGRLGEDRRRSERRQGEG